MDGIYTRETLSSASIAVELVQSFAGCVKF